MATDFAVFLRRFLTAHLAGLRGYSPNTIASYRDAFKLLICYFRDERSIPPERLTLELIDAAALPARAARQLPILTPTSAPSGGGERREYWIQAEKVRWNIVPRNVDQMMDEKIKGHWTFTAWAPKTYQRRRRRLARSANATSASS